MPYDPVDPAIAVPRSASRQPGDKARRIRPEPGTAGEGPMIRRTQDDRPSGGFADLSGRVTRRPAPQVGATLDVVATVEPLVGGTLRPA